MVNDKLVASHQNILKTYSQGEFSDFQDLYSYDYQLRLGKFLISKVPFQQPTKQ